MVRGYGEINHMIKSEKYAKKFEWNRTYESKECKTENKNKKHINR